MAPKRQAPSQGSANGVAIRACHGTGPLEFDNKLALHLVTQWCWGQKSATEVQKEAMHAYDDQVALLESLKFSRDFTHRSLAKRGWQ